MRKKPGFLEDVAEAAAVPGNEDALCRIRQRLAVEQDPAFGRSGKASNDADHGGLARAGTAEERRHAAFGGEGGIEPEGAEAMSCFDDECHSGSILLPAR